ncbi:MAG: PAS domain-containing protein [Candidatus Paceibacterota bacterium]
MEHSNFRMEQFDKAVMNETATWWQMRLPSGVVLFGDAKAKMLGYPEDKFKHYQDFVDLVHPDDREKTMQAMRDHLAGAAKFYETTYRIQHKDGSYLRFYDCGQVTERDGDTVTVTGFVMKVQDGADVLEQVKEFKDLILEGHPSIVELVSRIKNER